MKPADASQSSLDDLFKDLEHDIWKDAPSSPVASSQLHAKRPLSQKSANVLSATRCKPQIPRKAALRHRTPTRKSNKQHVSDQNEDHVDLLELCAGIEFDDVDMPDTAPSLQKPPICRSYWRCIVHDVQEGIDPLNNRPAKILTVSEDLKKDGQQTRLVYLADDWFETPVECDDVLNVLGPLPNQSDEAIHFCLANSVNLLIHHPDTLITSTAISSAIPCARKPLLQERLRNTSPTSEPLLYGNLLHELFQTCLVAQQWSESYRAEQIDRLVKREQTVCQAWEISKELADISAQLLLRSTTWPDWASTFVSAEPKPEAALADVRGSADQGGSVCLSAIHDIEEDIWSPRLGLKGKIDVSVQARVKGGMNTSAEEESPEGVIAPFEIKTGKAWAAMEHRAQTMLYTLLMSDRYDQNISSGLLYYTQTNEIHRVAQAKMELRGLIQVRNQLANYASLRVDKLAISDTPCSPAKSTLSEQPASDADLWDSFEDEPKLKGDNSLLPAPIDDYRTCKRCYASDACMLFRKAIEDHPFSEKAYEEGLGELFEQKTGHLSRKHLEFFKKWERLISLEERELVRSRKELWTMSAEERQEHGRCFAGMVIDLSFSADSHQIGATKIHQYTYRFVRSSLPDNLSSSPHSLLNGGHMQVGEPVAVSMTSPADILAVARGFILEVTHSAVVVGLNHSLTDLACAQRPTARREIPTFRIDQDEMAAGMGRVRDNLAQLFYAEGDWKRRSLIVDQAAPRFSTLASDYASSEESSRSLNSDQRAAVEKVLSAKDYALILGMPGTGKTTTIAEVITALAARGKTVLLTSYTHSAVDNILLKLLGRDLSLLRLGNPDKILPALQDYTLGAFDAATSIDELEERFMKPQIIATTALSINHALFLRRKFDYCIVDEASQITLPTALGPLRFADVFVLVGDHLQLPPLVRNPLAKAGGLETSLFKLLCEAHEEAVVELKTQYRMCEDVMSLSNRLYYSNKLVCGSEELMQKSLVLPLFEQSLARLHTAEDCKDCWLQTLLDPQRRVLFVDTDALPARESRKGHLITNEIEASLIQQTVTAALAAGLAPEQIGVLALYRQQIRLLTSKIQSSAPGVEILTADQSQGRDKEFILISLTRSNEDGRVGDLLQDWRRLNVCFTRAKSKLILFGSRSTLQDVLRDLFSILASRNWFYQLPPGAHEHHHPTTKRKGSLSQTSQQKRSRLHHLNPNSPQRHIGIA